MFRARSPRSFDPVRVGGFECEAWATYYQRRWARLLVASVGLVRAGFGMPWPRTLQGAWLVLRANQLWAPPPPRSDPDGARRCMEGFYRLVAEAAGEQLDTAEAARREVEWWRLHRESAGRDAVAAALVALYTFVYGVDAADVRQAAELRAEAMDVSDQWVREGCSSASPLLERERALLVRSYAALLAAVHR